MKKVLSKSSFSATHFLGLVCIALGLTLVMIVILHRMIVRNTLTVSQSEAARIFTIQSNVSKNVPKHLYIPQLVNIDVQPLAIVNNQWAVSEETASYVTQSALPGEKGNIVIYGHNKRNILGNLRQAQVGTIIEVTTAEGKVHRYHVIYTTTVKPTNVAFLLPTRVETLTLYTCTGFLDSERFIVRALPIE